MEIFLNILDILKIIGAFISVIIGFFTGLKPLFDAWAK